MVRQNLLVYSVKMYPLNVAFNACVHIQIEVNKYFNFCFNFQMLGLHVKEWLFSNNSFAWDLNSNFNIKFSQA